MLPLQILNVIFMKRWLQNIVILDDPILESELENESDEDVKVDDSDYEK